MDTNATSIKKQIAILALIFLTLTGFILSLAKLLPTTHALSIRANATDTTLYLPFIYKPVPPPAPIPQIVTNISLPAAALCPHEVSVNPNSGIAYVANVGSGTISLLTSQGHIATAETGEWPSQFAHDPNSKRTFMSNLHGQWDPNIDGFGGYTSVFDGGAFITQFGIAENEPAAQHEPLALLYHPEKDLIYVTDIASRRVRIFDGSTYAKVGEVNLGVWSKDLLLDPDTGWVYVTGWENGKLYTLDGTDLIHTLQVGWGADQMAFNPTNRYIYVAHSAPNADHPQSISIVHNQQVIKTIIASNNADKIVYNPVNNLVYVTNPDQNTVNILSGTEIIATLDVGDTPVDMDVNPNTGYVFVANARSHSISIIQDTTLVETYTTPNAQETTLGPSSVSVDTANNYVYVTNKRANLVCPIEGCREECQENPTVTVLR